ncbi:hypothetical protein GQ53DRAFT_745059 [Thozetella sp. PMI_491]|nr:hypothetical protein GQ53DRAFT_745059 [Thozetella sp. PMI_491]
MSGSNVSPAMEEYHLFPNFPKEIRDRIWELAWPTPGIHFLRLFDPWRHRMTNDIIDGPYWDMNFALGAPWNESLKRVDWIEGNISTYMVDNTLKGTCHESREATIRASRLRAEDYDGAAWASFGVIVPYDEEDPEMADKRADIRCFYMHKRLDLVCLQFCDYEHADSSVGWNGIAPFWGNGFYLPMIKDQEHVAIEYNRSWDDAFADGVEDPEAVVRELIGPKWVPFHFPKLHCFYVIDYSIARREHVPPSSRMQGQSAGPEVFFAIGKTFRVASPEDQSWAAPSHVHKLVAWLEKEYPSTIAEDRSEFHDWGEPPSPPAPSSLKFKVLACVDDTKHSKSEGQLNLLS